VDLGRRDLHHTEGIHMKSFIEIVYELFGIPYTGG
jgi:hypothetical protein